MDERSSPISGAPPPRPPVDWSARYASLRRAKDGRIAGGVAAGVAARTGMNVTLLRIIFVVTALFSGFGFAVYVLAWLFLPASGDETTIASRAKSDLRGITFAAVTASMVIVLLIFVSILGVGVISSFSWPVVIGAAGLVLIWRNASSDEQASMQGFAQPLIGAAQGGERPRIGLRLLVAGLLLIGGLAVLASVHHPAELLVPLLGFIIVVGAVAVLLGPWWRRVVMDLMVERQSRVRAEERADIAARVHDSVLQTLALIQRRADSPQQVVQLARAQERELRSWLFDGRPPGSMDGLATTVAGAVRLIQQDVEAQHGIAIEAVTVGDCTLDDDLDALLAAAREAAVNAAKWSGAQVISLFAEAEPTEVSVFVRDRGCGFDPAAVPADRKGLAESVKSRIERRGGSVTIRSTLGEGTEVSLTMPRAAVKIADQVKPDPGQPEPSRTQ